MAEPPVRVVTSLNEELRPKPPKGYFFLYAIDFGSTGGSWSINWSRNWIILDQNREMVATGSGPQQFVTAVPGKYYIYCRKGFAHGPGAFRTS